MQEFWVPTLDSYPHLYFMSKGMKCCLKAGMVRRIFGKSGNELEHKAVLQLPRLPVVQSGTMIRGICFVLLSIAGDTV